MSSTEKPYVVISTYNYHEMNLLENKFKQGVRLQLLHALEAVGLGWVVVHSGMAMDAIIAAYEGAIAVVFPGGDDWRKNDKLGKGRDAVELLLADLAGRDKKPILGICRGMQAKYIVEEKELIQDIQEYHRKKKKKILDHRAPEDIYERMNENMHWITIKKRTSAYIWLMTHKKKYEHLTQWITYSNQGIRVLVNSAHHQAGVPLTPDVLIQAVAEDGIIEAIESEDGLFQGCQFHVEMLPDGHPLKEYYFNGLKNNALLYQQEKKLAA